MQDIIVYHFADGAVLPRDQIVEQIDGDKEQQSGVEQIPCLWKAQNAFPRKQQFPELPAAKQRRQVEQQNMNHMDNGRNIRLLDERCGNQHMQKA